MKHDNHSFPRLPWLGAISVLLIIAVVGSSLSCSDDRADEGGEVDAGVDVGDTGMTEDVGNIDSGLDGSVSDLSDLSDLSDSGDADAADMVSGPCDDLDGDGFGVGSGCTIVDCDDQNRLIHPNAFERADDGVDDDCSGADLTAVAGPGIYVDQNAAGCVDSGATAGSKTTPFCTLHAATASARASNGANAIFLARGDYASAIEVDFDVAINGGYASGTWSVDQDQPSRIGGGVNSDVLTSAGVELGSWLKISGAASVSLHGLRIAGGSMTTKQVGLVVDSSGQVVVANCEIEPPLSFSRTALENRAGEGSLWLIDSTVEGIGGDNVARSTGVFNQGTMFIRGGNIRAGKARNSDAWTSFELRAIGIHNEGQLDVAQTVINAGSSGVGGGASYSFALYNAAPGQATVAHSILYGGLARLQSSAVTNQGGTLLLVGNILSGRMSYEASAGAASLAGVSALRIITGGAAGMVRLLNNNLYNRPYFGEIPSEAAKRNLLTYGILDQNNQVTEADIAVLNACNWPDCIEASGNVSMSPDFVDEQNLDFHIQSTSAMRGASLDPSPWVASEYSLSDIDGEPRPQGDWEIGIDEIP